MGMKVTLVVTTVFRSVIKYVHIWGSVGLPEGLGTASFIDVDCNGS